MRSVPPSLLAVLLLGCEGAGSGPSHVSAELRACADAAEGPVRTIQDAVDWINGMPGTGDVPCFVAGLPRPFQVVATNATVSAQPAAGDDNPRMFILLDGLVVSVVPAGDGAPLVEFGEWTSPTRSLKAEVELPVDGALTDDAPFERVLYELGGSKCGLCHTAETPSPTVPGGFDSVAFQPAPFTGVPFESIVAQHDACVANDDPSDRCALFHALLDFGNVTQGAFAEDVQVFGQ